MTKAELNRLEEIRLEVIAKLEEKYGADKVKYVNDLDASITWRMISGEKVGDYEQWVYNIVSDFESMLLSHPSIIITEH